MKRTAETPGKGKKAGGGGPKNMPGNLPVGRNAGCKPKNRSSTPKAKKQPPTARFYKVDVRIAAEDFVRGKPYFRELRYLARYVLDAYLERVNRAESNSKAARARILAGNVELLLPVIREMHARGELNFLFEGIRGGDGV